MVVCSDQHLTLLRLVLQTLRITLIKQDAWSSIISEGEYVSIWRHVFGILLGDTVSVRM